MTPDELRAIGILLYGIDNWVAQMARDLDVSPRSIWRWLNGTHPISTETVEDLSVLAVARHQEVLEAKMLIEHAKKKQALQIVGGKS